MGNEVNVESLVEVISKILSEQINLNTVVADKLSESVDCLNYYAEISGISARSKQRLFIEMTDSEKTAYYSGKVTCLAELFETIQHQNDKILNNKTIKSIAEEES